MEEMNEKELDINERVSPSGLTYFLVRSEPISNSFYDHHVQNKRPLFSTE